MATIKSQKSIRKAQKGGRKKTLSATRTHDLTQRVLASNLTMVCAKSVWSFLFLVLAGIGGGCAARQTAAPSHQYALAEKMTVPGLRISGRLMNICTAGRNRKRKESR